MGDATSECSIGIWMMANPDKWKELCAKAAVEQDPKRLLELITEINQILEQMEEGKKAPTGRKVR